MIDVSHNISMRGGEKYSTQSSEILKRLFFCTHTFGERSAPFDSLLRSTIRWRAAHASRHAPTHSVVSTHSRCRGAGRITAHSNAYVLTRRHALRHLPSPTFLLGTNIHDVMRVHQQQQQQLLLLHYGRRSVAFKLR